MMHVGHEMCHTKRGGAWLFFAAVRVDIRMANVAVCLLCGLWVGVSRMVRVFGVSVKSDGSVSSVLSNVFMCV